MQQFPDYRKIEDVIAVYYKVLLGFFISRLLFHGRLILEMVTLSLKFVTLT